MDQNEIIEMLQNSSEEGQEMIEFLHKTFKETLTLEPETQRLLRVHTNMMKDFLKEYNNVIIRTIQNDV